MRRWTGHPEFSVQTDSNSLKLQPQWSRFHVLAIVCSLALAHIFNASFLQASLQASYLVSFRDAVWREVHRFKLPTLGLVSEQLERDWVGDFEGKKLEREGGPVERRLR